MKQSIRDTFYPLSYAYTNNETRVLFSQKNYSDSSAITPYQTYHIIPTGEFYVRFRLLEDAEWARFVLNDNIITEFSDLKANKWYDFFECPVNLYLTAERSLIVYYNWPRYNDNNAIDIVYISSNVDNRAESIQLGQSYCTKT